MNTRNKLLTLAGVVLLGLLLLVRWVLVEGLPVLPSWRPPPEGTPLDRAQGKANSFLRALQADHLDTAYGATTAGFQARLSQEAFTTYVARHPALQQRPRASGVAFAPGEFRYSFVVPAAQGAEQHYELVLRLEGGDWKVDELTEAP